MPLESRFHTSLPLHRNLFYKYLVPQNNHAEETSQNLNRRNRKGETIPLAYLEECHRYHELWLSDALTFQANVGERETERWISILQEKFKF